MNIFLTGMMGSGKSSVGQLLSKYLNSTFYDLDRGVEKRFNLTIRDIFDTYGEPKFREVESKLLIESSEFQNNVIATGGGIVINPINRDFLSKKKVYFLDGCIDKLYERATKKREQRPLLKDISLNDFSKIYQERKSLYNECATASIITDDKSIDQIAKEIINHERSNF
ncbi:MAG: shikimate kinase [Gammaproteobacteria bacterium]|jgi:shikimate kinase|nr:shikimate kinase [Gammaproteobacteria bacterium]|tara:strand:+ start:450 stop:956 length:507 start_codon:yes stop_codon:yes gene_type:complete